MIPLLNRTEVSVTLANKEMCDKFIVDWFIRNRLSRFDASDSLIQEISQILQDFSSENREPMVPQYASYPYSPDVIDLTDGICSTFKPVRF